MTIPYGKGRLEVSLPDDWSVTELHPNGARPLADPAAAVEAALDSLSTPLRDRLQGARKIAVAVNDKTRPVPHDLLLPPLIALFERLAISPTQVTFLIATGAHHPMTSDEFPAILPPEVYERFRVVSHDAKAEGDNVQIGATSRGTPAAFDRRFVDADFRIVVGNIEPHQFMGFSGGVKSAVIGLAAFETVNRNHSLMTEPGSRLGEYDDNPARQDVEELGRILRIDLALNVVLNDDKKIVEVICDDPVEAMRRGIPVVRRQFEVPVEGAFDLTITSPGGHPKDINLYQAQKALAHAALITRPGGPIILVAACPEGTGSDDYESWVGGLSSHEEVVARFKSEGFRVGPHKAYQISRDAMGREVYLVSEMAPDRVRRLLLVPSPSLDEALAAAGTELGGSGRVAVMPYANATIPVVKGGGVAGRTAGSR